MVGKIAASRQSGLRLLVIVALLCIGLPVGSRLALAVDGARPDQATRAYFESLDPSSRQALRDALRQNMVRSTGHRNPAAIPLHQIYQAVFQDALINPASAAAYLPEDLELIASTTAHGDPRLLRTAQQAMATACQTIDNPGLRKTANAIPAVQAFQQARRSLYRTLDAQYAAVINQLSESGRLAVEAGAARLMQEEMLVSAELDLENLSFLQPGFVLAFLSDTCANIRNQPEETTFSGGTLEQELAEDFRRGAVQIHRPGH